MATAMKELKPLLALGGEPERLDIMMVLTGAHVLYKEFAVLSLPTYGFVQLDPAGREIYDRMYEEGSIDMKKLEGHFKKVDGLLNLPYPVKKTESI
jgi:hypothetical protein